MSPRRNPPPPSPPAPDADPYGPDDIVIIDSWQVSRIVLRHQLLECGCTPAELKGVVTIAARFEIDDVVVRLLPPRGIGVSWPDVLSVRVDGTVREGRLTRRARNRISRVIVRHIVEGDLSELMR